jgi:hypothetical protein
MSTEVPVFRPRLRFPAWEQAYAAVLQATDNDTLFKLVEIAEAAMLVRRDCLEGSISHLTEQPDGHQTERKIEHQLERQAERRAIEEALRTLSVIKKERLRFFAERTSSQM